MKITSYLFFLFLGSVAFAQNDFMHLPAIDTMYEDYIKTIEFHPAGREVLLPIVALNGNKLICKFDDHYGEYIDYFYTIRHCDKQWNFTPNVEISDYLDGPSEVQIETFGSSINTIANYTNYQFIFPNADIKLRWTGNYLLIVYDADGTVAFTKRFYVYQQRIEQIVQPFDPMNSDELSSHQAFRLKLDMGNLNPLNPTEDLFTTVFQNRFNERPSRFIQPTFVDNGNRYAEFDLSKQLSFPGYKEYRFFDTREIENAGLGVNYIEMDDKYIHVLLNLDKNRHFKPHFARQENNGGFVISRQDGIIRNGNGDLRAEYPTIFFNLKSRYFPGAEVYVIGEFNDFKLNDNFRMNYLQAEQIYSLEVPMKQGYYNYMYAVKWPEEEFNLFDIEGSSFETENDYHFFTYFRPRGTEYDQIIAYRLFKHNPQ